MLSPSLSVFYFFRKMSANMLCAFCLYWQKISVYRKCLYFYFRRQILGNYYSGVVTFFNITIFYLQNNLKAILFKGFAPILKLH